MYHLDLKHFKGVVVSDKFHMSLIQRHRMVNEAVSLELQNGLHALSIAAKTPTQCGQSTKPVSASPACSGGFGK
jgi:BolA protein